MPTGHKASEDLILIDPELLPDGGGVRLGTLVLIRWMAVAGQLAALAFVGFVLGFDVRPDITVPIVLTSAVLNLWYSFRADANTRLNDRQSAAHLAFDLVHLATLLFVTGGLANPFSILLLAPTSVSASILGQRSTKLLIALSLVLVSALAVTPFPLPWSQPPLEIHEVLMAGLWVSLCFTLVFLALYMARVGREGRHRARALAATQIALEQEQKLSALGTLAAAAAHELGTPLGTILLAARDRLEILQSQGTDPDAESDLELIVAEATRCRNILSELREQRRAGAGDHFTHMALEAVLREAAAPHEGRGVSIRFRSEGADALVIRRQPELVHAVRNIVENAAGYARRGVDIVAGWDNERIDVIIDDDGPGFDPQIVKRLGEPYVTTRQLVAGRDGGLGLGLFIAKTLLERTGATLTFDRSPTGGARVWISWRRDDLEQVPETEDESDDG
ncbi:MAG: HAMP domain-containing histidine kinase [Alphaproteobacteria bacterium]|nr:MAG: HAMP domain-containing histidine kinase [Alphaproteobacteria bacterium]